MIYAVWFPLDDEVESYGSWEGRLLWESAVNKKNFYVLCTSMDVSAEELDLYSIHEVECP